jgi:hypothetical protein
MLSAVDWLVGGLAVRWTGVILFGGKVYWGIYCWFVFESEGKSSREWTQWLSARSVLMARIREPRARNYVGRLLDEDRQSRLGWVISKYGSLCALRSGEAKNAQRR